MTLVVPLLLGVVFAASLMVGVAAWRGIDLPAGDGTRRRPRVLFTPRLAACLAAGLVALVVTRWPVGAAFATVATALLPRFFGHKAERQARLDRIEALASWAEQLRDTLAGAAGVEETLLATVRVAPLPLRPQLGRLAHRLDRHPLVASLRVFADELDDPLADLIVSALILGAEKQVKDLGALLGALAATAREEAAMHLRVEAGRARTRSAVQIITIFTLSFAGGLVLLNRGYLSPFDSTLGQAALALVGGCFAAAFWLMDRMTRPGHAERILVHAGEEADR
jgi:Flp pilus assembly protein TadB